MATRTVTGTILKPNGSPWGGASIQFRPRYDSFLLSPDVTYPIQTLTVTSDRDGLFEVELAAGLSTEYEVKMPDGETFSIIVSEGPDTTLELLRAAYLASNPEPAPSLEIVVAEIVTENSEFLDLLEALVIENEIEGPQGPIGLTGPTGAQGPTGATGPAGSLGTAVLNDLNDVYIPGTPADGEGLFYKNNAGGPGVGGWKAFTPYFGDQANTGALWSATSGQVPSSDGSGNWNPSSVSTLLADSSDTVKGKVELATTAETTTGTDAVRAVTPKGLHDMTSLSGAAWMLDEDNMSSNLDTKVPSQQSVKAYVDALKTGSINFGVGSADAATVVAVGTKQFVRVPYACTITGWTVLVSPAATVTLDIWKIATGTALPTNSNSITASAKPGTTADDVARSTTLTGWTTSVAAGDLLGWEVEANNSGLFIGLCIEITRA